MKILLLNADDINGGAARAANRLLKGLQSDGQNALMLVQKKESTDYAIIKNESFVSKFLAKWGFRLDGLPVKCKTAKSSIFTTAWIPGDQVPFIQRQMADIVHIHWISNSFIQIEQLAEIKRSPLIWTLHDAWAFTGGCHYPGECELFLKQCGLCPMLESKKVNDISRRVYLRKQKTWPKLKLTVVTPSQWLKKIAAKSSLLRDFRVECIPNGINIDKFKPMDKISARNLLGLPLERKLIAFGAMSATSDKRKGFHLLLESLKGLSTEKDMEVVIFGANKPIIAPDFGLRAHYFGQLHDDFSLIALYSAVDVFVAPSIEENLSNTVMESLACGTPVVAFNIGGMPDMVVHQVNGYLAAPFSAEDFSQGIRFVLQDKARWASLSAQSRNKVISDFEISSVVHRHMLLYKEAMSRPDKLC